MYFWPKNWDKEVIFGQNDGKKVVVPRTYHRGAYLKPMFRIIKFKFHIFLVRFVTKHHVIFQPAKNYHVFNKKKSFEELKSIICPKFHQLVPIYRWSIEAILVVGLNIIFEKVLFFRKLCCGDWPKSAIFT